MFVLIQKYHKFQKEVQGHIPGPGNDLGTTKFTVPVNVSNWDRSVFIQKVMQSRY